MIFNWDCLFNVAQVLFVCLLTVCCSYCGMIFPLHMTYSIFILYKTHILCCTVRILVRKSSPVEIYIYVCTLLIKQINCSWTQSFEWLQLPKPVSTNFLKLQQHIFQWGIHLLYIACETSSHWHQLTFLACAAKTSFIRLFASLQKNTHKSCYDRQL